MPTKFHGPNLVDDAPTPPARKRPEPEPLPVEERDSHGRLIISLEQYNELSRQNERLDRYAMKWLFPGYYGVRVVEASKFNKWWGQGARPVDHPDVANVKVAEPTSFDRSLSGYLHNINNAEE